MNGLKIACNAANCTQTGMNWPGCAGRLVCGPQPSGVSDVDLADRAGKPNARQVQRVGAAEHPGGPAVTDAHVNGDLYPVLADQQGAGADLLGAIDVTLALDDAFIGFSDRISATRWKRSK